MDDISTINAKLDSATSDKARLLSAQSKLASRKDELLHQQSITKIHHGKQSAYLKGEKARKLDEQQWYGSLAKQVKRLYEDEWVGYLSGYDGQVDSLEHEIQKALDNLDSQLDSVAGQINSADSSIKSLKDAKKTADKTK
jgi:hypothetical protein